MAPTEQQAHASAHHQSAEWQGQPHTLEHSMFLPDQSLTHHNIYHKCFVEPLTIDGKSDALPLETMDLAMLAIFQASDS